MEKVFTKICAWFEKTGVKIVDWIWGSMPVVLFTGFVESIGYCFLKAIEGLFWGIRAGCFRVYNWAWTASLFFGGLALKISLHIEARLKLKIKTEPEAKQ